MAASRVPLPERRRVGPLQPVAALIVAVHELADALHAAAVRLLEWALRQVYLWLTIPLVIAVYASAAGYDRVIPLGLLGWSISWVNIWITVYIAYALTRVVGVAVVEPDDGLQPRRGCG